MSQSAVTTCAFRLFAGIAGGLVGTIVALGIWLLSSFANPSTAEIETSYSMVVILAMVFLSSTASNLLVGLFLSVFEKEKYGDRKFLLTQIFLFTLVLFLLAIPFYLFAASALLSTAGMHLLISALMCALICEIVSGKRYSLSGLMGVIVAGCFLFGLLSILFSVADSSTSLFIVFSLPLTWIFIILGVFFGEMLYRLVQHVYGLDMSDSG